MAGVFTSNLVVDLESITFPEFMKNRTYDKVEGRLLHQPCRYDIIFGRDALSKFGITLDFDKHQLDMDGATLSMRNFPAQPGAGEPTIAEAFFVDSLDDDLWDAFDSDSVPSLADASCSSSDSDPVADDTNPVIDRNDETDTKDCFVQHIQANDYSALDVEACVDRCTHLTEDQRSDLKACMLQYPKLFDGKLRTYPGVKVHLDIDPDVPPRASRAYTVPHAQLPLFKQELDRLVSIGVLERGERSRWISGTFIVPKKDGKARWVSDFRALNRAIKRKVYPIPRIQDILQRQQNYKFLSKIDLSMCFYTYELDEESKAYTTISTPFGLYRYTRMPMGISQCPDVAQELLEKAIDGLDNVEGYFDDIAVFSGDWTSHIQSLHRLFATLEKHGYSINPSKCEWGVEETDWLGHYLTPTGIKPWAKKVQGILKMDVPRNLSELRSFIGLVNYYRDMWPRRAHILAPLTELTGKRFHWTDKETAAFKRKPCTTRMESRPMGPR